MEKVENSGQMRVGLGPKTRRPSDPDVSASDDFYLALTVRWPSGRRRRFAKAAKNQRTGLKLMTSAPILLGRWLALAAG